MPITIRPTSKKNRSEGIDLLEKALQLLGWSYALVDDGSEEGKPVQGMLIGTDAFIKALEQPAT